MNIICLLSVNPCIKTYNFFKSIQLNTQYDVYIVIDNNNYDIPNYDGVVKIIKIDNNECEMNGFKSSVLYFDNKACSRDKALYYFSKKFIDYDHIWFVEEDVFIPNIYTIENIDKKYNSQSDLIVSSHTVYYETQSGWWHWDHVMNQIKPPASSVAGLQPPASSVAGLQPPASSVAGLQPPASSVAGLQPPASSVAGLQPPASSVVGLQPPASSVVGLQPPASSVVGLQPPASSVVGLQPPASSVAGLQPPYAVSMICAIRCSKAMLNCISEYAKTYNNLFMDEVLFNTLAIQNNLRILCIPELSGIHWNKNWEFSDIVNTEYLYHPIKNIDTQYYYRELFSNSDKLYLTEENNQENNQENN